jgi:hypothetical protein
MYRTYRLDSRGGEPSPFGERESSCLSSQLDDDDDDDDDDNDDDDDEWLSSHIPVYS